MKLKLKVKKVVKALKYSAGRFAGRCCPLMRNTQFTPFVILTRSRSGSNLLKNYLNSVSTLECFGEIFRHDDRIGWDRPGIYPKQYGIEKYLKDPIDFLNRYFLSWQPKHVRHAGFKLFYYHSRNQGRGQLWEHLQTDKSFPVIHLRRRGLLRTVISREIAMRTGVWIDHGKNMVEVTPFEIEPDYVVSEIEKTIEWEGIIREEFRGDRYLEIEFEDLIRNPNSVLEDISKHLGLSVVPRPISATKRQGKSSLEATILNYDVIVEYCKERCFVNSEFRF